MNQPVLCEKCRIPHTLFLECVDTGEIIPADLCRDCMIEKIITRKNNNQQIFDATEIAQHENGQ